MPGVVIVTSLDVPKKYQPSFKVLSKYVFFSGTHLYDSSEKIFKKKIVVKQVNVLPQINYLFFFNRNNFFKTFLEKKYDLVFEKKNLTDEVNYDNFKNFLKNIQYSDFLFSKKL